MKLIPLSKTGKHKGRYFAIVDNRDFKRLNKYNWIAHKNNGNYYAARKDYKKNKLVFMHRVVMNTPDNLMTDHKKHNTLDNRKKELRICSRSQNAKNITSFKNSTSKYLGVCLNVVLNSNGRSYIYWQARIKPSINERQILLGNFKTEIEAAKAYNGRGFEQFDI